MAIPVKKTIPELEARYKLHPNLKDLYMEGPFDCDVIEIVSRHSNKKDVTAYPIDTVDVPDHLLTSLDYTSGNRQKVIALSVELSKLEKHKIRARCIVDKDEEQINGIKTSNGILLYTDYTNMELYFLTEEAIAKLILSTAGIGNVSAEILFAQICIMASEIFFLRTADKRLKLGIRWIKTMDRYCEADKKGFKFNLDKYISSLLESNGYVSLKEEFLQARNKIRDEAKKIRNGRCFNSHDFLEMLAYFIRNKSKEKWLGQQVPILRVLLTIVDPVIISNEDLFKELFKIW